MTVYGYHYRHTLTQTSKTNQLPVSAYDLGGRVVVLGLESYSSPVFSDLDSPVGDPDLDSKLPVGDSTTTLLGGVHGQHRVIRIKHDYVSDHALMKRRSNV